MLSTIRTERRRHPRVPDDEPLYLEQRRPASGETCALFGHTVNISQGGVLAHVDGAPLMETSAWVVLELEDESVRVRADIVRATPAWNGFWNVALRFDPAQTVALQRIAEHIDRVAAEWWMSEEAAAVLF